MHTNLDKILNFPPPLYVDLTWFLHIFRAIMVVKPLHYKRLVTKQKVHITYHSIFILMTTLFIIAFIFFTQAKFTDINQCLAVYILGNLFAAIPIATLLTIIMLISSITVIIKLKQRTRNFGMETSNNANDINSQSTDSTDSTKY